MELGRLQRLLVLLVPVVLYKWCFNETTDSDGNEKKHVVHDDDHYFILKKLKSDHQPAWVITTTGSSTAVEGLVPYTVSISICTHTLVSRTSTSSDGRKRKDNDEIDRSK